MKSKAHSTVQLNLVLMQFQTLPEMSQQSIVNYLRQHADTIRSHLPGWAAGLLAPLGLGAGLSSVPHATSAAPPLAAASEKTG